MEDKIIEGIAYALPALVCGGVAYLMFNSFAKKSDNEMNFNALVQRKRDSLPTKLQAYERLVLFCERINPSKLLLRINPIGNDTDSYLHLLIANIEQEFEHNLVQQIYVSEDSWKAVVGSKLAVINKFREVAEKSNSVKEFRENLLIDYSKIKSPTDIAIEILKASAKKLI